MSTEKFDAAIRALTFLLQDTTIDAIRFRDNSFTILFTPIRVNAGEVYLHLDAHWTVTSQPTSVNYPPPITSQHQSPEAQLLQLYALHRRSITHIMLSTPQPNLTIVFEHDTMLIINGHHDEYEQWQVGTAMTELGQDFLIIALPGDRIMVLTPNDFDSPGEVAHSE